ncbi:MAG: hypothetical protein H8F28_24550 [Fibrella sp.]|nr:hypothetical protein [Armatimonadota bacterium]
MQRSSTKATFKFKRNLFRGAFVFCVLTSVAFLVQLPLSYRFYTSVGIDTDRLPRPELVHYRYYRLRCPGDGSIRIGGGAMFFSRGAKPLEPFDLAASLLQPPRIDPPRTIWNRLGFWRIDARWEDAFSTQYPSLGKPWQSWVGVPVVLPTAVFMSLAWIFGRAAAARTEKYPGHI